MGIALRVHVAGKRADAARMWIEERHQIGRVEHARRALLHARVPRPLLKHGQPTRLELGSRADGQIGAPQLGDQGRPCLDVMRILAHVGGRHDLCVGYQDANQGRPLGFAGKHLERADRAGRGQRPREGKAQHPPHGACRPAPAAPARRPAQPSPGLRSHARRGRPAR